MGNWILYFSLPILELFIDKKLLKHWALFVEAIHESEKTVINQHDLEHMESLVKEFMIDAERYYTKMAMTYNVHQLLPWVKSIADWVPTWAHTAFAFETGNGKLLRMVKSANGVTNQICRQLSMRQCDKLLTNNFFPASFARVKAYCMSLKKKRTQKSCKINSARYFGVPSIAEQRWIEELGLSNEVVCYRTMVMDKCLYTTTVKRNAPSNNTFAELKDGTFIKIFQFIVDEYRAEEYVMGKILKTQNALLNQCKFL